MIPFLSEDQLPLLERARKQRARDVLRPMVVIRYPAAEIDLSLRLWEMQRDGFDVTAIDRDQFNWDLRSYEDQATDLLQSLDGARLRRAGRSTVLLAKMSTLRNEIVDQSELRRLALSLYEQRNELMEAEFRAKRRVHDLNQHFVRILAANLPQETAASLTQWYSEAACPVVFPDPFDIEFVLQTALTLDDLSADQRVVLEGARMRYCDQRDAFAEKMTREYLDWNDLIGRRAGTHTTDEYDAYQATMERYQHRRQEAADNEMGVLLSTFTQEQLDGLDSALTQYNRQLAGFAAVVERRARRMGGMRRWPRPLD